MIIIAKIIRNTIIRMHILNLEIQRKMCLNDMSLLYVRSSNKDLVHEQDYVMRLIDIKKKVLDGIEREIISLKKDML